MAAYGSFVYARPQLALRSNLPGELTRSGFVEFLSVERVTQALTKVGGSVTPRPSTRWEEAADKAGMAVGRAGMRVGGGYGGGRPSRSRARPVNIFEETQALSGGGHEGESMIRRVSFM
ncbi:hypothetical protein K438DRAFT_1778437 [Mycena galopus ATCC 62051]|nr:hypothetical protein K438DRAFT_1778437 [Mycena galopus ATCC 62051]